MSEPSWWPVRFERPLTAAELIRLLGNPLGGPT